MSGRGWVRAVRQRTRQTTIPHLRHSPTMSRAQRPTLPLVIRPGCRDPLLKPLLLHAVCAAISSRPRRALGARASFEQRRVCVTSWLRYWSRFARNCRQVLERSCREFKSRCEASSETMLFVNVRLVGWSVCPHLKQHTDSSSGWPKIH